MNPILLGTGASEGIPCVFCECPVCRRARELGGREVRSRSSMLLDERNIVDFSRDLFHQALQCKISLHELEHIFLTHFHEDHISVEEMGCRMSASPAREFPVEVYCSAPAAEQVRLLFERFRDHNQERPFDYFRWFHLHPVEPWEVFSAGALRVTPVLSSHHGYGVGECGYNYLFDAPAGRLLYAVDTGWYRTETWDFLWGKRLDCLVIECTYGDWEIPEYAEEHLNLRSLRHMLERFREIGCIGRDTPVVLTHICHLNKLSHEELQAAVREWEFSVTVGWDGMRIFPSAEPGHPQAGI